ncbi:myb/SANT-like DNA-binding domain-containing protein 3 [Lucilia sericata]|uniref:myb/SANT-like DNA-binding domain-containing protein 3 n=1 Tax=Lucilia sericata TaxID=13632 RepID=UPI0018A84EE3|nr:myb/SANT-like DNA-binding domain-containing protein 3 [Lucilia sericata]
MKQKEKRTRCQNFSLQEEDILISLVEQYKDIVESKKIDGKTSKEKHATWEQIQNAFCTHTGTFRTAKMLREKYENMKKKAKLLMATQNNEDMETSSCSCTQLRSTTIQRLVGVLAEAAAAPVDNSFEEITRENIKKEETWNDVDIEAEVLNVTPDVQILTHENWKPPTKKSKKSLRLNKAKKRKILNYEKATLRSAKAKLKFFKNEEIRAAQRHVWERELNEKRLKWEAELNEKKLELLNVQIEKEKYHMNL